MCCHFAQGVRYANHTLDMRSGATSVHRRRRVVVRATGYGLRATATKRRGAGGGDRRRVRWVTEAERGSSSTRLASWAYALRTTNPPPGPLDRIDAVTRWIVVGRAAVLPMTLVAGLVAALLAVGQPGLDWRWLVLAIV